MKASPFASRLKVGALTTQVLSPLNHEAQCLESCTLVLIATLESMVLHGPELEQATSAAAILLAAMGLAPIIQYQQSYIPSDESLEQGRNPSRELHFTAERPDKPYLASVGKQPG